MSKPLTMERAIDLFIADMRAAGRINSVNTERAYRAKLGKHAEDMDNRSPAETTRADVKTTLRRWDQGRSGDGPTNTLVQAHAILSSFYGWTVEEEIRPNNPVDAVRAPKKRQSQVYKLTQAEVLALLWAAKNDQRDNWMARIGVCAGLRAAEMLGVRGKHFRRAGWVWVSKDIAKGKKERWIPVIPDLEDVAEEIRATVADCEFVLAPRQWHGPVGGVEGFYDGFIRNRPLSYPGLHKAVISLGARAAVMGRVTPHTLRHAFGDYIARTTNIRVAQALMGHESIETTSRYTNELSLDDLAAAVAGLELGVRSEVGGR